MSERTYLDRLRDWIAWGLASAALRLATPWYRAMIGGSIALGLEKAKGGNHE